jgi:hypothetical protein
MIVEVQKLHDAIMEIIDMTKNGVNVLNVGFKTDGFASTVEVKVSRHEVVPFDLDENVSLRALHLKKFF